MRICLCFAAALFCLLLLLSRCCTCYDVLYYIRFSSLILFIQLYCIFDTSRNDLLHQLPRPLGIVRSVHRGGGQAHGGRESTAVAPDAHLATHLAEGDGAI